MNCEDFDLDLMEAARGAGTPEAIAHAQTCGRCAASLADQRELTREFAVLAAKPEHAPSGMEGTLLAALARRKRRIALSKVGWFAAAGAIAAALVIGFARRSPPIEPPSIVRFADQPPSEYGTVAVARAVPKRPRPRRAASRLAKREPAPELASDFYPIPYADPLTPVEHAEMVRVKVDDQLNADLILGQDGLARAIRFVNVSQTRSH